MITTAKQVPLDQAFDIAKSYFNTGNLSFADRTLRDIILAVPDHYPSLHLLGIVSYHRGNLAEALDFIARAVELDSSDADMLNNYGIMLSESGSKEEAVQRWRQCLAIKPDYAEAHSNLANTLWQLKRHEEAETHCRRALDLKPDFTDALLNLGNVQVAQGRHKDAIATWKKAVDLRPGFSLAWSNIGNAYRELGRLHDSETACRRAIETDDRNAQGWCNLGNAVRDLGRPAEAETHYRKATALQPNFVTAHNNLAIALIDQGRYEDAAAAVRYAVTFDPDYAEGWSNLSLALRELGQMDEAELAANRALKLKPDSASAHIDVAETLFLTERLEEAEDYLKKAMELEPGSARILLKLSGVLERANRIDEALKAVDDALELNPEMPESHYRKASIHFMTNQLDEARESLNKALRLMPKFPLGLALLSEIEQAMGNMDKAGEIALQAIEMNPGMPFAYMTYGKTKKYKKDDPDFIQMQEMAENPRHAGRQQQTSLHYALFKAYEDVGDYGKAFDHLSKGAAMKRQSIPYEEASAFAHIELQKTIYPEDFLKAYKNKGYKSNLPVFIVGMPRSGTTLTEQIISSHPDVYGAGELQDLTAAEHEIGGNFGPENAARLGEIYIERIKKLDKSGKKLRITDKMPGNFMRIGMIAAALPDAKIIHCRRNAIDTCLSCYKQLFARGQYWSYDLEELGRYYQNYLGIMDHWRKVLPGRFLDIDYEETVTNFEEKARELIDYVGLPWNDACLAPHENKRAVLTASKTQVIQPVYKTSVESWRKYEDFIQPLIRIVAPDLARN